MMYACTISIDLYPCAGTWNDSLRASADSFACSSLRAS